MNTESVEAGPQLCLSQSGQTELSQLPLSLRLQLRHTWLNCEAAETSKTLNKEARWGSDSVSAQPGSVVMMTE